MKPLDERGFVGERETLAANAEGERTYQQRVQATELELRARLDRLRWQLTDAALSKLRTRLLALAEDEARYLPLMVGYLREGAEAIERDELVASVNAPGMYPEKNLDNWDSLDKLATPSTGRRSYFSFSRGGVFIQACEEAVAAFIEIDADTYWYS